MKSFFQIEDASNDTKHFAWAMYYGPLVGDMTFLNPTSLKSYEAHWKVNPRKPGLYIDDGDSPARKWSDFLGHGGSDPGFFVSERIVKSLASGGIPYSRVTEMPIAEVKCRRLKGIAAPRYFVLEADPGLEIDYAASGIPIDPAGRPILKPVPKPWPKHWKVRLSSWTGAELFGWPNVWNRPSSSLICTERIVELSKRDQWTNVRFKEMEAV